MFKVKNGMSPEIICDIFTQRINNHYNLRHINHFEIPFVRTVYNGTESVLYIGPKIWDIVFLFIYLIIYLKLTNCQTNWLIKVNYPILQKKLKYKKKI